MFVRCKQRSFYTALVAAAVLAGSVAPLRSADLTVSSSAPTLNFDDVDTLINPDWTIESPEGVKFLIRGVTGNRVITLEQAPENSLYIDGWGNVGLGEEPGYPFHVSADSAAGRIAFFDQPRFNQTASVGFRNNAAVSTNNFVGFDFLLRDTAGSRLVSRFLCSLPVTNSATTTGAFGIDVVNNGTLGRTMTLRGNRVSIGTTASTHLLRVLNATCNGSTWNNACSRELKRDVVELSADDAAAALAELKPVTYAYKDDPTDPRVGFIAEDAPELVSMPDGKSLSPMDIVAVLTKVVQQQEMQLRDQENQLRQHQEEVQALRARLAEYDSLASRVAALEVESDR